MSKKNIVFFHPDLGIGGAERLIIDAAVGLQSLGHSVTIFTSHCDPNHCFDEARDGTLVVRVRGNTIFPPNLIGRFFILCAILRQIHLVLTVIITGEIADLKPDVFFVDQLSACVPLLRMFYRRDTRILFYCHFPDKLLATRKSLVKQLYRIPFDWFEAWTTGLADTLVVNSHFTASVFKKAFPGLAGRMPEVVYPCVDTKERPGKQTVGEGVNIAEGDLFGRKKIVLSINRFERKKNIGLAIQAFAGLTEKERSQARLVVAGGYDPRVQENVGYHKELVALADSLGLKSATTNNFISSLSVPDDIHVLFLLSVPARLKSSLLNAATLLVYTPSHEHFGIVPLEAMLAGTPVLAAANGGPLETIVDGQTGWLRPPTAIQEWTAVMQKALFRLSLTELQRMADAGQKRVRTEFSEQKMAQRLNIEIQNMVRVPRKPAFTMEDVAMLVLALGVFGGFLVWVVNLLKRSFVHLS